MRWHEVLSPSFSAEQSRRDGWLWSWLEISNFDAKMVKEIITNRLLQAWFTYKSYKSNKQQNCCKMIQVGWFCQRSPHPLTVTDAQGCRTLCQAQGFERLSLGWQIMPAMPMETENWRIPSFLIFQLVLQSPLWCFLIPFFAGLLWMTERLESINCVQQNSIQISDYLGILCWLEPANGYFAPLSNCHPGSAKGLCTASSLALIYGLNLSPDKIEFETKLNTLIGRIECCAIKFCNRFAARTQHNTFDAKRSPGTSTI